MSINNISIKGKLTLLVSLPLIALIYFAGLAIIERHHAQQELQKLYAVSDVGVLIGNLVHELQKERGMTAGFLGSKGKKFNRELPTQYQHTDDRLKTLKSSLASLDMRDYNPTFDQKVTLLKTQLQRLPNIRQEVASMKIGTPAALTFYTSTIDEALQIIAYMMKLTPNADVILKVGGYVSFLNAKERAGIERAVLTNTFAADQFGDGMYERFISLIAGQENYISVFESMASDSQKSLLKTLNQHPSVNDVEQMRRIAKEKAAHGEFGVEASGWFKTITEKIDQMHALEEHLSQDIQATTLQFLNSAKTQYYLYLALVLILTLLVLLLTFKILNSILQPVRHLKKAMETVAESGEFKHHAAIEQRDEIGQMGIAFNRLLTSTQDAISEANEVVTSIAKGQFDQRIKANLNGDLNTLKQGVNDSVESIAFTMNELAKIMQALHDGQFNVKIQDNVEGAFLRMMRNAISAMNAMDASISGIIQVMQGMEKGQFQNRVETDARGDLLKLKNSINGSISTLDNAINDITTIVVAQSNGDLTQTITADYQGQIKTLKEAINATADKLTQVVSQAIMASNIVNTAAREVSEGSTRLSHRVQEQAAALEQTSATMDQMNTVVQKNTENARHTTQMAQDVQARANQGAKVMQQTIDAMNAIQDSSHRIAEIVTLIDGIAFQTNLLALNAAVEAARAGEQGRGFAVVAGEVRALAQKSAEAARNIKDLINESVTRINEGTELASQTDDALQGINESVNDVTEMIAQIARASSEQSDGIEQVHQAISQIDGVTQQNAALVEETSAASQSLSEQAHILMTDMGFFKTEKDSALQHTNKHHK